jgi:pimeloyl-ACP methyl ester carboxylesterase
MQARISSHLTIEYEEAGDDGQPLVLLHAFPHNAAMWQPQLDALASQFHVIAPDLYNFGPDESTFTVEQMAADVAALLDYLQIEERVVLGGLSMGGYVAMAFARQYPERLCALILADTRAEADTEEAQNTRNMLIEKAREEGAGSVWDAMKPKMFSPASRSNEEVLSFADAIAAQQSTAQVIGALQALRDRPDARESLRHVEVPALVIVGKDDVVTPPDFAQTLFEILPHAQLVTIPNAGHLSNIEQPVAFNSAVTQFVQSL